MTIYVDFILSPCFVLQMHTVFIFYYLQIPIKRTFENYVLILFTLQFHFQNKHPVSLWRYIYIPRAPRFDITKTFL
jgi:hypothetical protein